MIRYAATVSLLAGVVIAAGCTSSEPARSGGPSRIAAAPQGQVASRRLPPPQAPAAPSSSQNQMSGMNGDSANQSADASQNDGDDNGNTQVASLGNNGGSSSGSGSSGNSGSSSGGGGSLSRQSVLGAYKVTTDGGNCQIILSLTEWSGGYRAASRGCPGRVADISAWDVSGNQVQLKNSSGSNIASLSQSGNARYEGTVNGGQSISLYR